MTKKHYITITICSLVILISAVLFNYYYKEYLKPESFTIGVLEESENYKKLEIKDYISDDTVIFSQNINDVSFATKDGVATYEYMFDAKEFNGLENDYIIYINNNMANNLVENAGTISGKHNLNYYDVDLNVLCSTTISIDFSFYSLSSRLKVTLPSNQLGYLMNYFKTDNYIITIAENPFSMMNKDGEVNEVIKQVADLNSEVTRLSSELEIKNLEINGYLQEISELTQSGEDKTEEIQSLQQDLLKAQSEVSVIKGNLESVNSEIAILETTNADLLEKNTNLQEVVNTQKDTISILETTISNLEYQVDYYQQLLKEYENLSKISVSFKVDSSAYDVQLVEEGQTASEPETEPTKEGFSFIGWSLDGSTIVEVSSVIITENTTFIAVFDKIPEYTITFKFGESETIVKGLEGTSIDVPNITIPKGYEFIGWFKEDNSKLDNETLIITENTTYTAYFNKLAGLFDHTTEECIYTWDELILNSLINVRDNNSISSISSELTGDLVVADGIIALIPTLQMPLKLNGLILPQSFNTFSFAQLGYLTDLSQLTFTGITPPTFETMPLIYSEIYPILNNLTIYVPKTAMDTYKDAIESNLSKYLKNYTLSIVQFD